MLATNTLSPNWLGRIFSRPNVSVNKETIWVSKKGTQLASYPLQSVRTFASLESSVWGEKLFFRISNKDIKISFLQKKDSARFVEHLNLAISVFLQEYLSQVFAEFDTFVIKAYPRDSWRTQINSLITELHQRYTLQPQLWQQHLPTKNIQQIEEILQFYPLDMNVLRSYHERYQLKNRKVFFDTVESNPLTDEQRLGVIRSNDRNMVLAAAGTGKTSVIVAKSLDLIDRQLAIPSEVLVLAYNKAAAEELKERLVEKAKKGNIALKSSPHISTFHALGRQLLREAGIPTKMSVFAEDSFRLKQWVTKWIYDYVSSDPYRVFDLIELTTPPVDPFNFKTQTEYESYLRDNEFRTLNNEQVRGYQELLIANFLYINQINYEYEAPFVSKRRIEIGFDYRPDFHIKDMDIYIEHYGIDREGNTRPDINAVTYHEIIKKKRLLHVECKTTLIETFHYEWKENTLLSGLKAKLASQHVICNPMHPSQGEIVNVL